ncbi:hypothetical protein FHS27_006350 [Rhodopirellula rubra]|uniref:Uncharacterized protein n=1 Tax=Aporhodopirellula rubra TaxID=980271 RepID=A0A7W5H9F6_9BACT|nr:hypothetical protein [Aporhodopirellula rubra]MBB3210503.1 hypothetical protein [Aporhodopirellula rubra]
MFVDRDVFAGEALVGDDVVPVGYVAPAEYVIPVGDEVPAGYETPAEEVPSGCVTPDG